MYGKYYVEKAQFCCNSLGYTPYRAQCCMEVINDRWSILSAMLVGIYNGGEWE